MKELWSILMSKLKQIEPNTAALGIGLFGIVTILLIATIITKLIGLIGDIVLSINGSPLG